jgi:hypothetical protein
MARHSHSICLLLKPVCRCLQSENKTRKIKNDNGRGEFRQVRLWAPPNGVTQSEWTVAFYPNKLF